MKYRKNVLKEAGVLLIASLMILSAIVVTANMNEKEPIKETALIKETATDQLGPCDCGDESMGQGGRDQPGGGTTGDDDNNPPCYYIGEIISDSIKYYPVGEYYWRDLKIYIGGGKYTWETFYKDYLYWISTSKQTFYGGSTCPDSGYTTPPYNPNDYPIFEINSISVEANTMNISPKQNITHFNVVDLTSEAIMYSYNFSVSAGDVVGIPLANFTTSNDYLVMGYVADDQMHGFLPFRKLDGDIVRLQRFNTWNFNASDNNTTKYTCEMYVGNQEVIVVAQYYNKSIAVFTGNTSEVLAPQPTIIEGPAIGAVGIAKQYTFYATDPLGDNTYQYVDWGDGNVTDWMGPYEYREQVNLTHTWASPGKYTIKAKAKGTEGAESNWSEFTVYITGNSFLLGLMNNYTVNEEYATFHAKILLWFGKPVGFKVFSSDEEIAISNTHQGKIFGPIIFGGFNAVVTGE